MIDRGTAARLVALAPRRQLLLMRAPAEFGRLQAFRDEAIDRPGVDEGAEGLGLLGALRVAFSNVYTLDADFFHQLGPAFAIIPAPGSSNDRPISCARLTSACLTNQETMPGFCSTAGHSRCAPAGIFFLFPFRTVSRKA